MPIWTAYSRQRSKVIAYVIGHTKECVLELYFATKRTVSEIRRIYTDGNSCYGEIFKTIGISKKHCISNGKSQTHLIGSANSSIRDNLARFNRKSKQYSKQLEMFDDTLYLFFNHPINIR